MWCGVCIIRALKPLDLPVWHGPIGFGASGRAGLRAFAELVVARRSWGDLVTTVRSRETLSCLHQSSVSQVCRSDPTAGKDLIGRCSKPTGTLVSQTAADEPKIAMLAVGSICLGGDASTKDARRNRRAGSNAAPLHLVLRGGGCVASKSAAADGMETPLANVPQAQSQGTAEAPQRLTDEAQAAATKRYSSHTAASPAAT